MGAFSGLINLAVAFWFYQTRADLNKSLPEHEKKSTWTWFFIGMGVCFAGFVIGYLINWLIVQAGGGTVTVAIGDGQGQATQASGGKTGFTGVLLELLPIILGVSMSWLVRKRCLLNPNFRTPAIVASTVKSISKILEPKK